MARPWSSQRVALREALDLAPGTSRQLAERIGVADVQAVMRTLDNMVHKGVPEVVVLRHERVPGCRRPVPVYGRLHAGAHATEAAGVGAVFAQLGLALFGGGGMAEAAA